MSRLTSTFQGQLFHHRKHLQQLRSNDAPSTCIPGGTTDF